MSGPSPALRYVALGLRLIIAGIFVYAGGMKIWDFAHHTWATPQFFEDLLNYQLGSWSFALGPLKVNSWDTLAVLAVYLPWLEVVAGLALFYRSLRWGAALLLTGLMVAFMAALGSAWARGLDVSCGCFGHSENATDFPVAMTRDAAMLVALLVICWAEWRRLHATARDLERTPTASE